VSRLEYIKATRASALMGKLTGSKICALSAVLVRLTPRSDARDDRLDERWALTRVLPVGANLGQAAPAVRSSCLTKTCAQEERLSSATKAQCFAEACRSEPFEAQIN
jgi:hypothetical protein